MKISSLLLGGSLVANLVLVAVLVLPSGDPRPARPEPLTATATAPAGATTTAEKAENAGSPDAKVAARLAAGGRRTWDQVRADDLSTLAAKLQEAGFPPAVIRRVVIQLVVEKFDARRLELEKELLNAPYWQNAAASGFNDPKIGAAFMRLQFEQTMAVKTALGGNLSDIFAGSEEEKAMLKIQLGDIPPEKIDQLYGAVMVFNEKRQKLMAERGNNGPMLAADWEKGATIEKEFRESMLKFLTPAQADDFMMRTSETASRLRSAISPARPTEAEYRALYPIYQAFVEQFPARNYNGETPEQTAARKAAEEQMFNQVKVVVGAERAEDFRQAGDPSAQQLNQLVARLDLPISSAKQVMDVQADVVKRAGSIMNDRSLDGAARVTQIKALSDEANGKVSTILGGPRGVEAYKQYGGQWLTQLTQRAAQAAATPPRN